MKGDDQNFTKKLMEVDKKLSVLLEEIETGLEGGDQSLIDLINQVFDDKANVERLVGESEEELKSAVDSSGKSSENMQNVHEIIRDLQEEINRLMNSTGVLGPEALADAFDRSEKSHADSEELRDILDEAKDLLEDYEENLREAKRLTTIAIEKFGEADKMLNGTMNEQKKVDDMLEVIHSGDEKPSEEELEGLKKLIADSLVKASKVNEEAFDLLDEVAKFELHSRLSEITAKVEQLNSHSDEKQAKLKDFAEENKKFLDDMEKTLEAAEVAKVKAEKIKSELDDLLKTIEGIHEDAKKAIEDNDRVIADVKAIIAELENFDLKVEKGKENARKALEKIPEILKKIQESEKIIDKLDKGLEGKVEAAKAAEAKCDDAKKKMDFVLSETGEMKKDIDALIEIAEPMIADRSTDLETARLSKEVDKLEKMLEAEDKVLEPTKKKIDEALTQVPQVDEKIEAVLRAVQALEDEANKIEPFDMARIAELGEENDTFLAIFSLQTSIPERKVTEAETLMKESRLEQNLKNLRGKRLKQTTKLEQYRLEISMLEYQLSVIKMNSESLERRCFKRTRLEP